LFWRGDERRYVEPKAAGRRNGRALLQLQESDYHQYIAYQQSTSIVPGTLGAYWWNPASSSWVLVNNQTVAKLGTSIERVCSVS
jgi:hypothetical protein